MRNKIKLFFSICIMINMILTTTVFILSRSIDYAKLRSVEESNGKTHLKIEDISKEDVDIIRNNPNVKSVYEKQYYDGNKNLDDKAITLIGTNKDLLKATDTTFISGSFPKKDDEIILEKWVYENLKKYIQNDEIKLDLLEHGKKSYKISGIINDIKLNKSIGKIELYKKISEKGQRSVALIINDNSNKKNEINKIVSIFKKKDKDISINNSLLEAEENMNILSKNTLLICFSFLFLIYISVKGIYYISIKGKLRTYGTLRALGISKKDIFKRIFYEIFVNSIFPSIIGVLIGCAISIALKGLIKNIYELPTFDIIVEFNLLIISIPLALALLILTVENYIRILKYNVVDLIKYESDINSSNHNNMKMSYYNGKNIINKIAINNILQNKFKNLIIFMSLSIISSILAGVSFYYGMENITYNQEKKHSGSDYNYTIESYPIGGKTYTGLSENELDQIKNMTINNKKAIKDVESFKVVNGRIISDKNDVYDWNYVKSFTSDDSNDAYFKQTLKWVGREIDGKYEMRSNIIGVDDSYIEKIKNSIEDFDLKSFKDGNGAILYDPLHQEKYEGIIKNSSFKKDFIFKYPKNFSEQMGDNLDEEGNEKQFAEFTNKKIKILGRTNNLNIRLSTYVGHETVNLIVSNKYIDKYIGLNKYKIIKLDSHKNVDVDKFKTKLLEITRDNPSANVLDNKEDIVKANVYYDSKKNIFIGFMLLLLVIFSLNLFNSMTYRISLRKQEYIFIKNIGATISQVRKMLITEGFATGVIIAIVTLILTITIQGAVYNYYKDFMLEKVYYNNTMIVIFIITLNILIGIMSSAIGITSEKL